MLINWITEKKAVLGGLEFGQEYRNQKCYPVVIGCDHTYVAKAGVRELAGNDEIGYHRNIWFDTRLDNLRNNTVYSMENDDMVLDILYIYARNRADVVRCFEF